MRHIRLLLGWLILVYIMAACTGNDSRLQTDGSNRLVYGLTLQPSGIDPHINSSSELGIPLRQVYDTLVYRDPETTAFVPGLAAEWTVSDDGLTYTFKLRQGVTFHDGTPFNAQAVAANLDRIVSPETASQKAVFLLGTYASYKILDEYTIQINLTEPYSPLLDSLSQVYLGIASPAALAQYSTSRYQFHQVGTGPFRFVEYVPGDRIVLQRSPDYRWGPAFYQAGNVETVEFRFFTDAPTRAAGIESGAAQVMGELLPTDARALTANSAIQLIPVATPGQPLQFLMNTRRFPTDNRIVRQALLFGTNRNTIIDTVFQRFSPVAWGPLSANTLFYSREMIGLYAQDTAQAQALLASAGFQDSNNNGYLDVGGIELEVKIIVPPWGLIPEVAQLLQDQWRAIGVRAILEPVPTRSTLLEQVQTGEYNLVAFYSFGLDPVLLNQYFLSDSPDNWTGYASPDLDNLLLEAARAGDVNTRRSLYAQAQRVIMDEALILPIRDYVNLNAASAALKGLSFDAYGWFPLLNNASMTDS
ncbi:MAG: hypothetical protein HXY41_00735 [Chloroflexi bacterium]|nr:hypothetical protein [Chloroflexota bacterium]